MNRLITMAALLVIGYVAQGLINCRVARRQGQQQREALQTWEGEGGAVPVAPNRIAAQVLPRPKHTSIPDPAHG